ncbi:Hypothetical protein F387_01143 [Wohlfahrtiimonas chitiniclastica SH04]|uniref:Uncharacterized protein n=1 Tax=Wohlfahrtiimonas chitiniclastica SH04 TaxID=1261130 RepID=L8Y0P4_9GAMM|nr:Hypothetical protein F387_01143 [Wohlfahrtiimonas chitiniclastica SH04]OYQ80447.1 hypothetical protein B9T12_03205 [Wohlfahrtiimonas chitiniclastica]OYQ90376.1 hypothetical protein B9T10_03390 [Wohlfahrtiimonas chitiniclastica]
MKGIIYFVIKAAIVLCLFSAAFFVFNIFSMKKYFFFIWFRDKKFAKKIKKILRKIDKTLL